MFDAHNHGIDDLAVALALGEVMAANLSPEDRCAIENLKSMSVVNFNFMSNVGTIDNGDVVAVSGLHHVYSLVETKQLIHQKLYYFIYHTQSQINLNQS